MILSHITARTPVPLRHLIEPGTLLSDLRFDTVERLGLGNDIELGSGLELPEGAAEAWLTVADVLGCLDLAWGEVA